MKKILSFILLGLLCSIGMVKADTNYYTPTADEVIILKDVYSASATSTGYSTHSAIAWGGKPSTNSKTAGDPNNNGAATSSNVPCYNTKGNGGAKNITLSISGVSKVIIYHEKHSSRKPNLQLTPDGEDAYMTTNGVANVYYNEFELDGTKSYSALIKSGDDFYVYAVKLFKQSTASISSQTFAGVKVGATSLTQDAAEAGFSVSGTTITLTADQVAYSAPSDIKLVNHIVYSDETSEDKNVEVVFGATPSEGFYSGTATIDQTTYTVKVPAGTESITAVSINGIEMGSADLATLQSTHAVSIDGGALNGIGMISVTLNSGAADVTRANNGNDAVFTFTCNSTSHTVTVTGVKKTYSALGAVVSYADGYLSNDNKTLTANGVAFTMVANKTFQYGAATVTIGEAEYTAIKLSTGSAVNVTFPDDKVATKVKVYAWSQNGDGKMSAIQETSDASGKKVDADDLAADIYYAYNTVLDIYPSVYEYELDRWESLYFNPAGSPSQPFVVMDFVLVDKTPAVTYTVTYKANGSGEADVVKEEVTSVEANPFTREGYQFAGWNTAADGTGNELAVGDAVTNDITLYAQWEKVCNNPIYDLVGGEGSAEVTAAEATVNDGVSLVLSNTNGRIKLTPAAGKKFKNGDRIEFSGTIGNTSKKYGVYVYASDGSTKAGDFNVNGTTDPLTVSGNLTLTSDQDYIYIARRDGSTTTLTSLVISQLGECPEMFAVTYHANGSGEEDVVVAEATKVAANPFTYENHVFLGWNTEADGSGDAYAVGSALTADLVLYAQWQTAYTVSYYFGSTLLHSEKVYDGENPAEYATAQTKVQSATFNGWYKDAALTIAVADISAEVIAANTPFYGSFTTSLDYATSINIESYALRSGKDSVKTVQLISQMGTQHYASNFAYKKGDCEIDYLDDDKTDRNYAYLGLKIKKAGTLFNFLVAQGQTVKVKFGNVGTTPLVSINGSDYANMLIENKVYSYTAPATEDAIISIKTADAKAVVLQQIAIGEDLEPSEYQVELTIGEGGYSTYAADYKYTVSGATVYKAAYDAEHNLITLTEVEDAVVPVGAGIILKGTASATATLTASSSSATTLNGNELVGVPAAINKFTVANAYVIATQVDEGETEATTKFYPYSGASFPAHKAYMVITPAQQGAPIRIVFAEETTTDINSLEASEKAQKFFENGNLYILREGVVYDATGRVVR